MLDIKNDLGNFFAYMDKKDIFTTAVSLVIGSTISNIVKKFADEIVTPLSKGNIDKLKKFQTYKEYALLIGNFLVTTFILYKLLMTIKNVDKKI
jgi:large-conductance mechanosensitive channel